MVAHAGRRFQSLEALIAATGLRRDEVVTLADIGALNSFGYDRRSALWQAERAGMTEAVRRVKQLSREFPDVSAMLIAMMRLYGELGWKVEYGATAKELVQRFPDDQDAIAAAIAVYESEGSSARADELFAGAYRSVFRGRGMEFAEVREYLPGDEVRSIDWNVTARMGRPFVKRYVEERELTVMLAVDLSGSSQFGTVSRFKSEMAIELAAVLTMSAVRNNDRVGLVIFTDRIEHVVPPRKGRRHVLRLIREHYCNALPIPGGCNLGLVPYWVGVKLLGTGPGPLSGRQVTLSAWDWAPPGDERFLMRDEDTERYAIMSAGTIQDLSAADLQPQSGDPVVLISTGPFAQIDPGDSISVDFALVGGAEVEDIQEHSRFAQRAFDRGYVVPVPPPSPLLKVIARDGALDELKLPFKQHLHAAIPRVQHAHPRPGNHAQRREAVEHVGVLVFHLRDDPFLPRPEFGEEVVLATRHGVSPRDRGPVGIDGRPAEDIVETVGQLGRAHVLEAISGGVNLLEGDAAPVYEVPLPETMRADHLHRPAEAFGGKSHPFGGALDQTRPLETADRPFYRRNSRVEAAGQGVDGHRRGPAEGQ